MFAKETYITRRKTLKSSIESGILLFLGNKDLGMNYRDNLYPFRQDSSYLYYWGLNYPNLAAIIDIDEDREIIFGDEQSIDDIVWTGTQPRLQEMAESLGVRHTLARAELGTYLSKAIKSGRKLHYLPSYRADHDWELLEILGVKPAEQKPSESFIRAVVNQRNYKTDEEILEIERACDITVDMHLAAIRDLHIGMKEYEIAAKVEAIAVAAGGRLSFPTIATVNGQYLHNPYYHNTIKEGDMLLLDAGAETAMGYAGDMSSTIPAGKTFSRIQRDVYDIQVEVHKAAVDALRPDIAFIDVHNIAAKVISEGMKSLGFLKGNAEDAVHEGAYAMFFQCGLGHLMGLDVHDMENLGEAIVGYDGLAKNTEFGRKSLRLGRKLEEGFVVTIEPGIYFIPELIDSWKAESKYTEFINYDKLEAFKNFGGIRNEENYLITRDGARRLGKKLALTADEVESLR